MRVHETKGVSALLMCDLWDGRMVITCGKCEANIIDRPKLPVICPVCREEMYYRPWYEW